MPFNSPFSVYIKRIANKYIISFLTKPCLIRSVSTRFSCNTTNISKDSNYSFNEFLILCTVINIHIRYKNFLKVLTIFLAFKSKYT